MGAPRRGRPFKWPWLTLAVGRSFVLEAQSMESVRTTLSRARRLWGVDYTLVKQEGKKKYRVRRFA
jgi:hypothetical protein